MRLQYVGRIFVLKTQRFADLYPLLLKRAELPEDTKLAIYEEIKFDPTVMVELQNPNHSLANAQLEDGDILCLQEQPREVSISLLPKSHQPFAHSDSPPHSNRLCLEGLNSAVRMKLAVLQACLRSVCGEHVGVWVVAQDDMEELPYPTVKDYLVWVRNRMTVTFRRLDQPKVTLIHPCHHPDLMLGAVDAPPNLA